MSKVKWLPQRYIDNIKENNPSAILITTEYTNHNTELRILCQQHNVEYAHSLKNAMRCNGCKECQFDMVRKKSMSEDEFKKKVNLKNPHISILGLYTGIGTHILCMCNIHNIEFSPHTATLLRGSGGCPLCMNEIVSKQRISSDDIKDRFHSLNNTLTIVDNDVKLDTFVRVHCAVCNCNFSKKLTYQYISNKKCKCNVCINREIVDGFNDVATLRPDLIPYFKDQKDAHKYGPGQTKELPFVCVDCGYEKTMKIEVLARQGFACPCCGDGISYPNKFVRSLVRQLSVSNIAFEYSPKWANGYFYDCYFQYQNTQYIIEVDGQQHFKQASQFKMSIDEVRRRDKEKELLATENGHVLMRIDAQKSDCEYLKYQIENSELASLFDLRDIDWNRCSEYAMSNIEKEVCVYVETVRPQKYADICDVFGVVADTVRKYLYHGIKLGWCGEAALERLGCKKRVNVYHMDNSLFCTFDSITQCCDVMSNMFNQKYSYFGVRNNCNGITEHYHGYIFRLAYNE